MPTAPDRAPLPRRRLLPLTVLIAAAVALLAFAATAAAETKIGEGTSPIELSREGESDLLKATSSFDVTTGTATFEITTREAQESTPEAERPEVEYTAIVLNAQSGCTEQAIAAEEKKAEEEEKEPPIFPAMEILSLNEQVTAENTPPGVPVAQAYGAYLTSEESVFEPEEFIPGSKSLDGTTATVTVTIPQAAGNGSFNCVGVAAQNFKESGEPDEILFPLTTKIEPPPAVETKPAPAPSASSPALAPGMLSIAKAKPLKLKVGKWKTVKVKVTNTGATATSPGSLRLKPAKGVVVKGGKQKLPALLPGGSWTVSFKVKLTPKAKKSSKLSLVGAAGSLAATGSLVLKSLGG
jgi:hypothetical protein